MHLRKGKRRVMSPRWQNWRFLNFPPPMDDRLYSYKWSNSLWQKSRNQIWVTPTHRVTEKILQISGFILKGAHPYISCPNICSCHLENGTPRHLCLIGNGTCIHESHRTIANEEVIFKCRHKHSLHLHTWAYHIQHRLKGLPTSFSLERIWLHIFPALPEALVLISLQIGLD